MPTFQPTNPEQFTVRHGPYHIYAFLLSEGAHPKAKRYLSVPDQSVKLSESEKAADWTLEAVPETHGQFFIYKSRGTSETAPYQALKASRIVGNDSEYTLAIESVNSLQGAPVELTRWRAQPGTHANQYQFFTYVKGNGNETVKIYWHVDEESEYIPVNGITTDQPALEFTVEEVEL